jgi:hypothetical protein
MQTAVSQSRIFLIFLMPSAAEVRFGPVLGGILSNPEPNLRSSSGKETNPGPDHS